MSAVLLQRVQSVECLCPLISPCRCRPVSQVAERVTQARQAVQAGPIGGAPNKPQESAATHKPKGKSKKTTAR